MPDTQYFYADGNEQRGPHTAAEIVALRLPPQTLVWHEGMGDWQRLDSVAELMPPRPAPTLQQGFTMTGIGTVQQPPPYATPVNYGLPPRDSSKKVAAGVFGILLGGFGVHKFILGYTTPGLIMCLVSVLTCGMGLGVFWIIGIIEGIIYLSKSDEEFYTTYVLNKREWF